MCSVGVKQCPVSPPGTADQDHMNRDVRILALAEWREV